jgi:DNA-binding GntR family transcriptional regulator
MRLFEKRLCDELGVSRTVVRESLRQLESERLIDMKPNIGPVVHMLTRHEAEGLYEIRASLEALAGRLAAAHATPEQVATLRSIVVEIGGQQDRPLPLTLELKNTFYKALFDASANAMIGELLVNIQGRISELRSVSLQQPGRLTSMVEELEEIVEAIARGDASEAARQCQAHVQAAATAALSNLPEA